MIKSRFTNILSTLVCCILFIALPYYNASATPPGANCHCVISIVAKSSCNGVSSGSATATATNGTAPYTYRWSNGQTTASATGLASGTYTVTATDKTGCTASQSVTISSVSLNVNAGSDKTICRGGSTQLSASGATMYSWSPSTGLSNASIANPVASPTVTTTYTVTGVVSSGELVTNGNFSSGNTGFTSGYSFNSDLVPEGRYFVGANANNNHNNFFGTGRGGSGNFMIINGATVAGVDVWRQTISVSPNTTYYFSTWITALNNLVSANLAFKVNGVLMGPIISSPSSPNTWIQFYAVWNSGTATTANISIVNQNTIANGNDFGLDDISFTSVCEDTDEVVVTVNSATANAGADQTVCTGQSATLTATGGGTYLWSTGATTATITVNPTATTTYTVTVTNNSCTASDQVKVTRVTSTLAASVTKTDVGCKKDSITTCVLTLATSQHGLWLDDIPSAPNKYHKIVGGSMTATKYSDGRLKITGTFENVSDVNRKWTIDVMYTNKMNWTEFSARGGTWKGTAANVGTNYLNWDYYIMDTAYANKLTGSGTYAGKVLNLTHMPSNYLYGFQVGQGANDMTADWGMSGWFEHTGSWTGNGDINFDAVCDSTEIFQSSTCNGTADLTVSGGTAPITYAWSNGRTSQDLTGLCAGTYTVTITDGTGCTVSRSVTVGTASALTVVCNSTDVTTQGGSNGIASVSVTGGATPYKYLWSTGHTTQSVTNRPAGVYYVTVTDAFGCEVEYECCIKQPSTCEGFRTQTQGGWGASPSGGNPGTYVHANFATAFPSGLTVGCPSGGFTLRLTSAQAVTDFLPSGSTARALTANLTNPGGSYSNVLAGQVVALSLSVGFDNANPSFGPNTTPLQNLVVASGTFANWTVAQVLAEANKKLGGCSSTYSFSQLNEVVSKINENYVDGNSTGSFLICGIELATVKVDVRCFGQNTGSIDLTPSGGVLPYSYAWSNGATTQDLTNVAAGTYSVTVTAANNLTATTSVTIGQPTQLSLTTTKTDLNCNGVCTGTASVTATGGTAPYTYRWNNNATTAAISNLCAGTYTVTVTDANNCTAVRTATLIQPADLVSSIIKTDVSCGSGNIPCQVFQYAPGSHAVYLPNLGLGSASWVFGPQGGTIETFANGTARIYGNIYYISDTTKSFFLDFNFSNKSTWAQWSALGRTWKGDAGIVGNNFQNWTYYIFSTTTPSTLTGRNSYTGNNLSIQHYPANLSMGLQIGLAANDKNGSYGLSTWFSHTGWKSGQGDINANLQCVQGQCDGTTDVTVSGGTSPYTYSWNTGATSQDLSGLCPGTYTITITDAKGCKDTLTATIGSGSELVLNATGTNIACAGVCNGTATVTATGGATPYTYLWSNGATSQSLSNICAGTYIVTVTDSKGCFGKDTIIINANPKPEITATATAINCFGDATGSVTTTVTGGTAPFTYAWTGGATTANLTNRPSGTYSVTVTDANGCKDTATATITQPASALSAAISSTPVSCIGGNDGTATVVASGGTAPYTYSWSTSPARTTAAITGLNVGSYSVTVTDAKGCTVTKTVQVTGVPPLTIGSVPSPVLCNGGNTGSINATISGGTPGYTFRWSNGATTEDITGLAAGTYTLTVTDSKGCVATASVTVQQPQPISASAVPTNVNCNGGSTGKVTLTVSGGTSPYTYRWNTNATSKDLNNITAGTYTVTITDANNCTATANATVTQKDSINVITTATHVNCTGGNNGTITTTVTGGTSPFTYLWSNGATTANLSNLAANTYYLTVTDANGCIALDTTGIVQRDSIGIIVDTVVNALCYGDSGSVTISVTGGTPVCTPGTYTPATTCTACTQTISGNTQNIFITAGQKVCVLAGTTFTGSLNMSGGELVICGTANPSNFSTTGGTITVIGTLNANVINLETAVTLRNYGSISTPTNITGKGKLYNYGNISVSVDLDINSGGLFENYGVTRVSNNLNNSGTTLNNGTIFISNTLQNNGGATFTNNCNLTASVNFINNQLFYNNGQIVVGVTSFLNGGSILNMGVGAQHCTKNVQLNGTLTGPATSCASFKVTHNTTINGSGLVNGKLSYCDLNGIETNTGTINGGASLSCSCLANNPNSSYTYTVRWSTGDTTLTIRKPAGTYTVTVTDASGCTATKTVTINQPDSLRTTIVKTDVSCGSGNIPCQVFQYAPGSHAVYLPNLGLGSASWVFGPQGGTIETYANGTARIYGNIYYISDTTKSFFLDFNFSNKSTWAQWSALGRGWKGSAGIVGNNYQNWDYYIFSTTTPSTLTGRNSFTGNNLNITHNPSNYQYGLQIGLAANDKNGNYGLSTWFNHTGWKSGMGDINANLNCVQGQCDGTADLTVSGGTAPYTYAWSNGASTQDLATLCPGTYTVTITDKNGCKKITTVTINSGSELNVNATGTNIACAGVCNGTATVTATGGSTPYTYKWSNGATTQSLSNICAGTYIVTVTDSKGCFGRDTVVISANPKPEITATPSPVNCFGAATGSVTTTVTGGTAPFSYFWTPSGATTANLNNATAGTYTVILTDVNGCKDTASATITQPADSLNGTITSTPVSCIGGTDGTATVVASGGTAPYTYVWSTSPARTTAAITGLRAGSYTVTITDSKGCTVVRTVVVTTVPALTIGSVPSPVLCNGGNTGSINVTISGGTPGYTFLWSNGATTEDISGLIAGTYNVTVTDSKGCVATAGVSVTQPQPLVATATPANIACFGGNTGGVNVSVVGGTSPFTYIWSNGATTRDITGLTAGTYTVTVTDKNGCKDTVSATVTAQPALQVSATPTNVTCFGLNNGSITTAVNGGVAPYTYNWGAGQPTTANRTGLAPGTYTVTITDANNCTGTATATITQPSAALAATAVKTDVNCFGESTGTVTLTVTGGTTAYTYLWSNGATTQNLTGLAAGTYTVTVTDAKACTTTASATVTQPTNALAASLVKTDVNCFGQATGTATLTVTGGTAAYTYNWGGGVTTANRTGLAAGTYTVTVTDSKNCTATASVTITQPNAALNASAIKTDVNCFGGNNGTVTLTVTGGTTAYTYLWSNGATSQNLTGLAAGTYTVTVTDAKACTATATATVTQPADSLNGVTSSTPVSCIGGTDGTVTVVASGGTAPYTYVWSTTPARTTATVTGLRVGNYSVTITDAKGCTVVRTVTVTGVPPLTVGSVPSPVLCNGGNTGSINLTISGGTPGYTFLWSNGATTEDITGLTAGTYNVTVTDSKGCVATAGVTVNQPQPLVATASPQHIACFGANNGGVNLSVVGGTTPFTYIWSNGATTRDITGVTAGTYTVTVTDANGCKDTVSATVNQQSALQVTPTPTNVTCFGFNNGSITLAVNGGVTPYTYNWGAGQPTTANRNNLAPGTYNVTVTDANNCTGTATATITQPADSLNGVISSTPVSCIGGTDGTATVVASGGTAPYTYVWSTTPARTTASLTGLRAGSYTVTITDAKGCIVVRTVVVTTVPALTVGAVPSPVLCFGGATGSVNATISGGTPGYTFLWSNGATTEDLTNVAAGTYNVTVTDSKGCVATAGVTITQPQALVATATPTNIPCFGSNTGTVTLSVVGGTTPFTYIWSNGATTRDIAALGAGTYTVTVTDKNGCKDTVSATVTAQPSLVVDVTGTNLLCHESNTGTATATVAGGLAPYTYAWNTTPVRTTAAITGLSIGTYSVTVTDANGCTATDNVVLTQPDSLEALTSCNAIACFGDTTADIVLLVVGGTTPYTYLWSTGATTRNLDNQSAGTYTVTVTDARGCTITSTAIVEQPAQLLATASPLHIACNGAATGGVNLNVVGGTAPYTYLWSNGATTQNLTGLVAGTYTVTVTDKNGCRDTATATINQQSALQVTATPTSIPCFGQNNGSVTTSVNGGVAPYTYNWGAGVTTANRSNLAPGTYTVTVTDANNCTGTATATVTQPADSLNGVTSSTPVSCIGGTDGTMTVVATGGTAPYTYVWSTTPARTTPTVTGLRVGNYSVTITDAKGCTVVRTITVTGVPPLTIGSVPSPVLCFGGNTGSINLTISGGTPGYTFLWSNGATTEDITGLVAGTYNVTVTDRNGCVATSGVTVQQPQPLVATGTPVNIACFGANNGGVNVSVVGGTSPFTYIWSNGATTRDITGVTAGTYTVTVTDRNGCVDTASATVTQQAALQVTATPSNVTCFGLNNGSITTAVNGGVAPYTYTWGAGQPTTANRSNLAPGTYNVTVTDANGCTGTATATITQPSAPLAATAAKTDVNCFGESTGTVTLTVSGGTTAYTYVWSNGATTQNLTGLAAGTYTVTVTDANLCTTTASATVTQPSAPLAASIIKTDVNCFGQSTGAADLTVTGGTAPYTYAWSNQATTQDLSGLVAGTYTVTVTDSKGCITTTSTTITQPSAPLAASAAKTDVNCFGGNNGTVTLTVSGGTTAYTYLWSNGATTQNLTGLAAGTYTVTVTDAKACTTTATATVTQPADSLNGTTSSTPVSCIGGTDGTMTVVATGGTAPYTYVWSTTPARTTPTVTGLRVGNYTVTITDAKGCTVVRTVTVTGVPPLTVGSVPSPVLCFGGNTGSINLTISGGTPGYTFLWSNGATTEDITGLVAGTYNVTVTDRNGCVATSGVTVQQPQPLVATGTPVNIACFGANNGGVNVSVVGGTSPFTYIWSNGATTRDITGVTAGTYTVTVTDRNACVDTASTTVTQQAALQVNVTPTNLTCFGNSTGALATTVNGGVAPYTYTWGAGQPTTANRTGLSIGTYSVTVTDANGCTGTGSATITQPDVLTASATGSALLCFGNQNGTVDLTVAGGTTAYTYLWSNGATSQDLNGLAAGTYNATVTDANGCTTTASATVTQPTLLSASATGSTVNCFGDATGTATLTVTGGTTGYTYLWSNGATSQNLSGLAAGTYTATITDANGCTATASATVNQPAVLSVTGTNTTVLCNAGNNAAITLTVTGGNTPYSFNWGGGVTAQNRTGLAAGTYTVTVTDAKGCVDTETFTITEPTALIATATPQNVRCFLGADGAVTTTVSGGVGPYTYRWSNNATTANLTALRAGSFTVTVTDANGCTTTATAVVAQPGPLTLGSVPATVSCFGGSNGAINLTATGGVAPYRYAWSTGATTEDISGLAAGTYNVTVTDANNCVANVAVTVLQPQPIALSFTSVNATTFGGTNGSIDLSVVGGTSPFTYVWSNGAVTQDLNGISAGNYCVTVTDVNGCTATGCRIITEPGCTGFTASVAGTNVNCFGGNNGTATTTITGGVAPFTYNWGGGVTTQNRTGLAAGTYSITITDAVNCSATASVTITEPTLLAASAQGSNATCNGLANGTVTLTVSGGTTPYTFLWSNGATTQNLSGLGTGTFTVTVTDASGCVKTASASITTPIALNITPVVTQVRCFLGSDGAVNTTVTGGTAPYTFRWSNNATSQNITALRAGTYTLTVTDANGCTATSTSVVGQPGPLTLGATTNTVSCFQGNDGAIDLTVTGGTAPYVYAWSNGQAVQDISTLAAGTYNVTVTDARGCVATVAVNVVQPAAINLTAVVTDACAGGNSGAVQLNVVGGTSPFTYRWSNNAVTKNIGSLAPGTYTVTVTDSKGCVASNSFVVASNVNCRTMEFTINVMLEGPYEPANMMMQNKLRTQCNTVPLFQPYNSPMMGYNGTESVGSLGNDVVDWVLISFRSNTDRNSEIYKVAGLLSRNGKVRTVTGDTIFQLNSTPTDSLYVVVEHRNHLGVMTPVKMCGHHADANGVICVDFTKMQSFTTGSPATSGQKIIGTDSRGLPVYGMYSGDGDCNFDINSSDFVPFGTDFNKFDIYSPGDFNMDCDCNSNDLPKWLNNFNQFSGVR